MTEIRDLFHKGGSLADLRYKEEKARGRPWEIAEEYTLDWSQSNVFLVTMSSYYQGGGLAATSSARRSLPHSPPAARYPAERVWRRWLGVGLCHTVSDPYSTYLMLAMPLDSPDTRVHALLPVNRDIIVTACMNHESTAVFFPVHSFFRNLFELTLHVLSDVSCWFFCAVSMTLKWVHFCNSNI